MKYFSFVRYIFLLNIITDERKIFRITKNPKNSNEIDFDGFNTKVVKYTIDVLSSIRTYIVN